jgi:hypothetical protein
MNYKFSPESSPLDEKQFVVSESHYTRYCQFASTVVPKPNPTSSTLKELLLQQLIISSRLIIVVIVITISVIIIFVFNMLCKCVCIDVLVILVCLCTDSFIWYDGLGTTCNLWIGLMTSSSLWWFQVNLKFLKMIITLMVMTMTTIINLLLMMKVQPMMKQWLRGSTDELQT